MRAGGQGSRERDRRPRGRSRGFERGSTTAGRISTKPGLSSPTRLSGRAFRPPLQRAPAAPGPRGSSFPATPRRFSLGRPLLPSCPVPPPAAGRAGSARLGKVRGSRADRCAECRRLPCARNPVLRGLFVSCAGQRGRSHEGNSSLTIHRGPFGVCPRPVPGALCRGSRGTQGGSLPDTWAEN